jgi:hypothetical protein
MRLPFIHELAQTGYSYFNFQQMFSSLCFSFWPVPVIAELSVFVGISWNKKTYVENVHDNKQKTQPFFDWVFLLAF